LIYGENAHRFWNVLRKEPGLKRYVEDRCGKKNEQGINARAGTHASTQLCIW
jgi:hypothetical protein